MIYRYAKTFCVQCKKKEAQEGGVPCLIPFLPLLLLLHSPPHSSIEVPPECSVELSSDGYQIFTEIFQLFDRASIYSVQKGYCLKPLTPCSLSPSLSLFQDKDGALKESELDELFSTSPGNPWTSIGFPNTTVTDESGAVTLQGFLAQWR